MILTIPIKRTHKSMSDAYKGAKWAKQGEWVHKKQPPCLRSRTSPLHKQFLYVLISFPFLHLWGLNFSLGKFEVIFLFFTS